jgi:hypothetical protein
VRLCRQWPPEWERKRLERERTSVSHHYFF